MSEDPGGDILDPGAANRIVERQVERHYLYKPKDEEPPPAGENWFEYNYRPRPAMTGIKVQIDPKPVADVINDYILQGNLAEVVRVWESAKIQVHTQKGSPVVTVRLVP